MPGPWLHGAEVAQTCHELALTRPQMGEGDMELELLVTLDPQWLRQNAPGGLHTVTVNGRRYIPVDDGL